MEVTGSEDDLVNAVPPCVTMRPTLSTTHSTLFHSSSEMVKAVLWHAMNCVSVGVSTAVVKHHDHL